MLAHGRSVLKNKTSEIINMRVTQIVRMRIRPLMDRLGNNWKTSLKKPESGEWKGAPGMKAANEAVNTKKRAEAVKMLLRVIPVIGLMKSLDWKCEYECH